MKRCEWCEGHELYIKYHDEEWGSPVYDDRIFFEFLVLESAQAGLNWLTILKKRKNYKKAYDNFDPQKAAKYSRKKYDELISNPGIIRNKLKIKSSINNAAKFLEIQSEYESFSNYIWQFTNFKPVINSWQDLSQIPSETELSEKISKDLKRRGFTFIGPTIVYSFLQATGLVNDHIVDCFRYKELTEIAPPNWFGKPPVRGG